MLARTRARDRDRALAPVRAEIRRRISRRAAIPADDDTRIAAAARRLGLTDVEVGALLGTATTEDEVLAAGRALARLGRRS